MKTKNVLQWVEVDAT